MKKLFLSLLCVVCAVTLHAQTRYLRVNKLDKTVIKVAVSEIDSIDFIVGVDDADNNTDDAINLPEETKQFLGFWENDDYGDITWAWNFLFRADGTCLCQRYSGEVDEGYWNYNVDTKQLSTTAGGGMIWNVTLATENTWMGSSVSTSNVWNFTKLDEDQTFRQIREFYTWSNDTSSLSLSESSSAYDGSGTVTFGESLNGNEPKESSRSNGKTIGYGYFCGGSFINLGNKPSDGTQTWRNSYIIGFSAFTANSDNTYWESSYTIYRRGTKTKTAK